MKAAPSLKDSLKEECERREREKERERMSRGRERDRDRRDRDRSMDRERDRSMERERRLPRHYTAASEDAKLLSSRVFIGNLPTENMLGNTELEDMFHKYGRILGVNMLKGYGFVQFEREEEARVAVEAENGSLYKGYRLDVKMAAEGRNKPRGGPRRPSPPPRNSFTRERSPPIRDRGSPMDDPYRRTPGGREPPRDPYIDRDPYRRDPYAASPVTVDPYRDPFLPPPQFDAMLIVVDAKIRGYGEMLERRLTGIKGMLVDVNMLRDPVHLPKALEEATVKKMMYAIVVNEQNEVHRSITLNVLHGTPQEHRNMPLEDAMAFVLRNFTEYLKEKETKAAALAAPTTIKPPAGVTPEFTPPDKQTSYLLNLMADNRFLTVDELDTVIDYLMSRRNRLAEQTGAPPRKSEKTVASGVPKDEQAIAQQQQMLQKKILNILNGSDNGPPTPQAQAAGSAYGVSPPSASNVNMPAAAVPPTSINFDNPQVQKALDNLISGGSSLLQNIAAVKNTPSPGAAPQPMYGQGQGQGQGDPYGGDYGRGYSSQAPTGSGAQTQLQSHDPYAAQRSGEPFRQDPYGRDGDGGGSGYNAYPGPGEPSRGPPQGPYGGRY